MRHSAPSSFHQRHVRQYAHVLRCFRQGRSTFRSVIDPLFTVVTQLVAPTVVMVKDAQVDEAKLLICEMCLNFYQQGWVGGTGGGMSIKTDRHIVMAPSGVQKERMVPDDMFVLDHQGNVTESPTARPAPYKAPKLSECSPLFMAVCFFCDQCTPLPHFKSV